MIPQLRDWHGKYEKDGLTIVGVHAPEFTWERPYDKVVKATKDLKVAYPVVQDNEFTIWKRFGNQYWPALVVVDRKGGWGATGSHASRAGARRAAAGSMSGEW